MIDRYGSEIFGLLGALVSLSFLEKVTVVGALIAIASGVSSAVVGAPILTHYMAPPEGIKDHVNAGFGLVLGISGFMLAGAVYASARAMRDWLPESVKKYLERKVGQ